MASTSEFVIAASNETNAMTKWLSDALTQDVMACHIDVPQYKEIPVALSAKTPSGSLVGALVGRLAWQTLYIQLLATNVDIRAPSGTGAYLLRAIEEIAREHQCTHLLLETYSWQARGFYEKLGFCVLGELRHNPPGHSKFMMEKLLTGDRKAAPMVASPAISVEVSTAEEMSPFLFDWLQRHTDRLRLSPPVPPYAKKFAAAECRLQHDNSTVVGGCVYQTLWAELQIRYFAVLPAYRGRGVGTRLLEYMEDVARSERCTQLIIHITSWQAWRWFLRKGFVEFGREKDYPPSHSRLYLVKHLHQVHI